MRNKIKAEVESIPDRSIQRLTLHFVIGKFESGTVQNGINLLAMSSIVLIPVDGMLIILSACNRLTNKKLAFSITNYPLQHPPSTTSPNPNPLP